MITTKEFLNKWNKEIFGIVGFDRDIVLTLKIPEESKVFLIEGGLPESAPPFLNFESSQKGGGSRLTDKFNLNSNFSRYIYLGFNGTGDTICIDEETGLIMCLDHENIEYKYFINSSIPQLVECILIYVEFIKKIKEINGRRAALEHNAPEHLINWVYEKLSIVDRTALKEESFWSEELQRYKLN